MKLFILATFISLAFSGSFFLRSPASITPISGSAPQSASDYFTALFEAFDLDQPNQLLECFNDISAALYFKHISDVSELVTDAENRNKVSVHLDWLKLALLDQTLQPLWGCIAATQDWSDLLAALGAKKRNPELFAVASFIYYQASFGKLAQELPQVVSAISSGNYTGAGTLDAGVLNTTANDIKDKGLALLALQGLWNGVHIDLGLPDAQSVYSCWDNDTASVRLEFIYGMSVAVANGAVGDSAYNVQQWYQETGNALLKKIPAKNWNCWKNSTDTKAESEKLGADITSQSFYDQVLKFVDGQQAKFWLFQKTIKDNLDQHNFIHAGSAYAQLLQAAADTK